MVAVALGLVTFGCYSCLEARWRKTEPRLETTPSASTRSKASTSPSSGATAPAPRPPPRCWPPPPPSASSWPSCRRPR
ncbi:hypothetical protein ACOZ38_28735 [Sphaerisporangium viridialbum]|uniref:hypothetical protein n=1 Tax=Sphaerisporangium viridialbum TaxID=46189 RepID=UPI003C78F036